MTATPLALDKFAERLTHVLPLLGREVARYDRDLLPQGEVTLPQLWALEHLRDHAACTMCELAKRLHLQGSSTTGLVDRLARYGLVQRRRSQADRRVVHVGLTPKGRRCMETLRRRKQTTLINWFGRLTQSERMHFLATVEKLVAGLASASASVPGAGQKDFS
jgi:DNA-binding MarR family transcriptional regulator